jgi:hypothetical protein
MKDHLITHIADKKTSKETYDALVALHQSANISRKMLFLNKPLAICISNTYSVISYLMKMTQFIDQWVAARAKVKC